MSLVQLEILEPQHDARFSGSANVRLRGRVVSIGHPPLFFKWYSGLRAPQNVNDVALNQSPDNPLDFTVPTGIADNPPALPRVLQVGSNILTFTAKDVAGDALNDLTAVQNAGMAGGPLAAESPCIIHVFLANILFPSAGATLSKASSTLTAQAPVKWGKKIAGGSSYELDPEYHAINRIQYRWLFAPSGPPAGRRSAEFIPTPAQLTFTPDPAPARVQYQGTLPANLNLGNYILTLRVEDMNDNTMGHQVSRNIIFTN